MSETGSRKGLPSELAPRIAVGFIIVAYCAIFGTLSLRRHQNLRTNALDLGYTDQAVWNTLHGRPFRFSTYVDAAFRLDIPIQDFKEPDMLLGYHVEPILAAIAPLYLLHDGPETLLWLQTVVIALGAVPVYLIVRNRLRKRELKDAGRFTLYVVLWLPVAFVFLYLLSPSLEAANLSDFHAVTLSATLLLTGFYFLEIDRPWGFASFAFLAAMCKEDVGLIVAMMGLWAAFVRRRWWLGLGTFMAGTGWFLISVQVIMPHFSGLRSSAFLLRYGHLGDSLAGMARNLALQPELFVEWLTRRDVVYYFRDLVLSSGGLAVLQPLALAIAVPSIAINALSSYRWMRSGGGHYSVAIVPFLVIASAYGLDWLAYQVSKKPSGGMSSRTYGVVSAVLVGAGLTVAIVHHSQDGISPLSRRFALEPVTEHARRAEAIIEQINHLAPDQPISVGSNLYPHVGHRERVYLFPTVRDAQIVALDVTGPASPVGTGEQSQIARELLDYAQFGIAASDHGFLVLERDLDQYRLSPGFYDPFLATGTESQVPLEVDFGGLMRLRGFDRMVRPVVRRELVVEIITYWQVLAPVDEEYRFAFYFWDEDGNLLDLRADEQTALWYPTWQWEPGQVVKLTLPPLPVGDLPHMGVAVVGPGAELTDPAGRLAPVTSTDGLPLSLWENDTILELVEP